LVFIPVSERQQLHIGKSRVVVEVGFVDDEVEVARHHQRSAMPGVRIAEGHRKGRKVGKKKEKNANKRKWRE
jgi:hypothetical protein